MKSDLPLRKEYRMRVSPPAGESLRNRRSSRSRTANHATRPRATTTLAPTTAPPS